MEALIQSLREKLGISGKERPASGEGAYSWLSYRVCLVQSRGVNCTTAPPPRTDSKNATIYRIWSFACRVGLRILVQRSLAKLATHQALFDYWTPWVNRLN